MKCGAQFVGGYHIIPYYCFKKQHKFVKIYTKFDSLQVTTWTMQELQKKKALVYPFFACENVPGTAEQSSTTTTIQ